MINPCDIILNRHKSVLCLFWILLCYVNHLVFKVYFKVYSKSLFVNKKGKALKSFAFSIYSKRVRLCQILKNSRSSSSFSATVLSSWALFARTWIFALISCIDAEVSCVLAAFSSEILESEFTDSSMTTFEASHSCVSADMLFTPSIVPLMLLISVFIPNRFVFH